MMKLLVVFLGLIAALANAYVEFPFPSYLRVLNSNDPYISSFCIIDGTEGTQAEVNNQQYHGVQACNIGKIAMATLSGNQSLWMGSIAAASVANLGTNADIIQRYNITNEVSFGYFSLRFDEPSSTFMVGEADSGVALSNTDVAPLRTTSSFQFIPTVGNIYLVRYTDVAITTTDWSRTTLFAKLIVSAWDSVAGTATIRWEILYTSTPNEVPLTPGETQDVAQQALAIGIAALVLAVLLVFVGSIAVCVSRRSTHDPLSIQSGNAYGSLKN